MRFSSIAEILVGIIILVSLFYLVPKYLPFLDLPLMYKSAIAVVPAGLIWHGLNSFGSKQTSEHSFSEETGELQTQPEMAMEAQPQLQQQVPHEQPMEAAHHESAE